MPFWKEITQVAKFSQEKKRKRKNKLVQGLILGWNFTKWNIFLSKTRIAIKLELNKESYDLHVNSLLPLMTLNNGYYLLYGIMAISCYGT